MMQADTHGGRAAWHRALRRATHNNKRARQKKITKRERRATRTSSSPLPVPSSQAKYRRPPTAPNFDSNGYVFSSVPCRFRDGVVKRA